MERQEYIDWLTDFTNLAIAKDNFDLVETAKAAKVKELQDHLENSLREKLEGLQDLELTDEQGKAIGKVIAKGGTQLDEADATEYGLGSFDSPELTKLKKKLAKLQKKGGKELSEKEKARMEELEVESQAALASVKSILGSFAVLSRLQDEEIEVRGPDGTMVTEKLFSAEEISSEFFQPLIRERLLPETAVPDPYSETLKMITATDALYDERIAKAKAAGGLTADWDPATSLLKKGGKMIQASADIAGACGDNAALASDILTLVALGVDTMATVAENRKEIENALGDVGDNLGKMVSGILTLTAGKEVGDAFQMGWDIGMAVDKVGLALAKDPIEWGDVVDALADGIGAVFAAANSGTADDDKKASIDLLGTAISTAVASGPKAVSMVKQMQAGNVAGAMGDILDIAEGAIKAEWSTKDWSDDETAEREESLEEMVTTLKEQAEAASKVAQADRVVKKMSEDSFEEYTKDANAIDVLIAKMQKDQMILELAAKLSQGGTALAAKFVPALGMANAGVILAANLMEAARRARDLRKWIDNTTDFETAQNALSAASQNFVKNQKEQFSHYTIQAAMNLVQLIGEGLKLGGITAAAGAIVSASASAAATVEEQLYDLNRELKLEAAWKMTVKARENRDNRRLALQARSMNPTLAKYCVAWGAVIKKDAMACTAMSACGLNETSLSHRDSNADKVVKYLEVYFKDDQTLVREFTQPPAWAPPALTLSAKFWTVVLVKAPELEPPSGLGIVSDALAALPTLSKAVEGSEEADMDENLDNYVDALIAMESALESYSPQKTGGGTHSEMASVVEGLLMLITQDKIAAEKKYNYAAMADIGKLFGDEEDEETAESGAAESGGRERSEVVTEMPAELAEANKMRLGAKKMLEKMKARLQGDLKAGKADVAFTFYENVKVKDGSYSSGPLLVVNATALDLQKDPYLECEGAAGTGKIVEASKTILGKKYFKFQSAAITKQQVSGAIAACGYAQDRIELVS